MQHFLWEAVDARLVFSVELDLGQGEWYKYRANVIGRLGKVELYRAWFDLKTFFRASNWAGTRELPKYEIFALWAILGPTPTPSVDDGSPTILVPAKVPWLEVLSFELIRPSGVFETLGILLRAEAKRHLNLMQAVSSVYSTRADWDLEAASTMFRSTRTDPHIELFDLSED